MSYDQLRVLMEHGEELGCVNMSAFTTLLHELELDDERLTLPHEQVLSRRFVLIPALELDFELTTPSGMRLADALATLPLDEGVRWAGQPPALPGVRAHLR